MNIKIKKKDYYKKILDTLIEAAPNGVYAGDLKNLMNGNYDKVQEVIEYLKSRDAVDLDYSPLNSPTQDISRDHLIWTKMFKYFRDYREEFDKRYHARSNVETSFAMIKKKYGNNVRTKTFNSNVNEIKIKCLCHNICVLIQEIYECGIDIDFKSCVNTIASV